ncbi:MAG: hypothetical protein JOY62_00855 [Acidobacteriaceae bacterium]|nr:hypothetical protein [Acidobacteriaceae bacterium]MBV9778495.1 hypothetical protein [Acidobacteriaceae bacterium]
MKVLLDENLPHDLRFFLRHHETFTAVFMGWAGLNNGKLLAAAEEAGFDVLVTGDRTLQYEQKPLRGKLALITLSAVSWPVIQPMWKRLQEPLTLPSRGQSQTSNAEDSRGGKQSHLRPNPLSCNRCPGVRTRAIAVPQ